VKQRFKKEPKMDKRFQALEAMIHFWVWKEEKKQGESKQSLSMSLREAERRSNLRTGIAPSAA
jgi:hypothetical protein